MDGRYSREVLDRSRFGRFIGRMTLLEPIPEPWRAAACGKLSVGKVGEHRLGCQRGSFPECFFNASRIFAAIAATFTAGVSLPAATLPADPTVSISALKSPIIFRGDATTAYRDPAAIYHDGWFYLYFELVKVEPDKKAFDYTAWSKSRDLVHWTEPKTFTPRDRNLNYGSPGDVVRFGDEWVLCLQTYPRPHGEKFGNADSRVWIMRSKDLENWGSPELLKVLGSDIPREKMGRMIDPFLLADKDDPSKWWCFFKQNGEVKMSWSRDLKSWTPLPGAAAGGENPCVIVDNNDYVLFYSPHDGIGVKRSPDLQKWTSEGILTLGQKDWPWAQGRLSAGFVLDLRKDPAIGKALMFFHGSAYEEKDPRGGFDNFASIGIAWSSDLKKWDWAGKAAAASTP